MQYLPVSLSSTSTLEAIRKILAQPQTAEKNQKAEEPVVYSCPKCHKGHLIPTALIAPVRRLYMAPG